MILSWFISIKNQTIKNYCIDYGCETVWAGYFDGICSVPAALIKYMYIDVCFLHVCKCAFYCNLSYPEALKKHATIYNATQVVFPKITKWLMGKLITFFLERDDQEIDQLQGLDYSASS